MHDATIAVPGTTTTQQIDEPWSGSVLLLQAGQLIHIHDTITSVVAPLQPAIHGCGINEFSPNGTVYKDRTFPGVPLGAVVSSLDNECSWQQQGVIRLRVQYCHWPSDLL